MPALTSTSQAAHNADRVVAALSDAGVPHLRHRARDTVREVVAVPTSHRQEAVEALRVVAPLRAHHPDDGALPLAAGLARWSSEPDGHVWLDEPARDPAVDAALGVAVACELQLWRHVDGVLEAPRSSPWGRWFDDTVLSPGGWPPPRPADEVDFPIDVVYTWVDDSDPDWEARRDDALRAVGRPPLADQAVGEYLFRNRDELRYSMRSLAMYAPFVRHVYLVTAGQRPTWLEPGHPRLTVVDHRDIFPGSHLPTFNSHAIEANLHRVDGLAEHYLYLNDDAFFGRPVRPELFFHANGITKAYLSKAQVPPGEPGPGSPGVDVAASNGRRLLERELGVRITQKLKHTPHAQRRSVVERLEEMFPEEFAATSSHRFRDVSDVSVPSSLAQHYGLLTGTTVHGGHLRYDYIGLEDLGSVSDRLDRLQADRDLDVFCLNDAGAVPGEGERLDDRVSSFLEQYYPVPSEFERG